MVREGTQSSVIGRDSGPGSGLASWTGAGHGQPRAQEAPKARSPRAMPRRRPRGGSRRWRGPGGRRRARADRRRCRRRRRPAGRCRRSVVDSPALARTAPGMCAAVAAADGVPVLGDLVGAEAEQADEVGVGAEAAVADADAVLGAEPGGDERVGHAVDGEGGERERGPAGVGAEQAHAGDRGQAGAQPPVEPASSWSTMASQPMRPSSSMAAWSATAPMTLGEPASSRSGGSVQTTSSRSTRSTAPPPARNGSPVGERAHAGRPARRRRTARTSCGRSRRRSRRRPGSGRCGGELGGVDEHRDAPLVGGGDDLVDRRQPAGDVGRAGDGEQPGPGPGVEGGGDVVGGEGAVGAALDVAPPARAGPTAAGWRGARRRW